MTRTPHNQVEPSPAETTPAATALSRQPSLPPLENVLAVAAGGAVGGSLRYGFIQDFPPDLTVKIARAVVTNA